MKVTALQSVVVVNCFNCLKGTVTVSPMRGNKTHYGKYQCCTNTPETIHWLFFQMLWSLKKLSELTYQHAAQWHAYIDDVPLKCTQKCLRWKKTQMLWEGLQWELTQSVQTISCQMLPEIPSLKWNSNKTNLSSIRWLILWDHFSNSPRVCGSSNKELHVSKYKEVC